MKAVEYVTEITPEGTIELPQESLRRLIAHARTPVRVLILFEEKLPTMPLPRFAGRWQDKRDAAAIVSDIGEGRDHNRRSESFDW